ncbi:sporulation histidine kinase inhibitor Sda [Halalkalibacter krulwichiae]|uniref:Sporulation inhibitor sda n=1 Tax=Halalkalibacter krulwichiae TaxID=199441 RepID=A0A1X9ME88_9BACI|nr:sporulation histidine kinase inhibitor Sda [Halalkalibacter krulwichiae]ARK29851.1 Sporulation inhibitor sda [Halalkalibacter krulwichiae]
MREISDQTLIEAYYEALKLNLDLDFILLLEKELAYRKLLNPKAETHPT